MSAAAALSVLDIIEEDSLIDQAGQVGDYLKNNLGTPCKTRKALSRLGEKACF